MNGMPVTRWAADQDVKSATMWLIAIWEDLKAIISIQEKLVEEFLPSAQECLKPK
jgi:hypothetical protein